jgi:hypothetical protein
VGLPGVAFISSARVAPFWRFSRSSTFSVLLPSRGPDSFLAVLAALAPFGAFLAGVAFFPDLGFEAATRGFRVPDVAFLLALGSSAWAMARAVASVSIFGVFIVNAPLAVITAVRTYITLVGNTSKRIVQKAMEWRWR